MTGGASFPPDGGARPPGRAVCSQAVPRNDAPADHFQHHPDLWRGALGRARLILIGSPPMRVSAGTSGFSYKEWQGSFYPEKLPASRMLEFYAARLPSVE